MTTTSAVSSIVARPGLRRKSGVSLGMSGTDASEERARYQAMMGLWLNEGQCPAQGSIDAREIFIRRSPQRSSNTALIDRKQLRDAQGTRVTKPNVTPRLHRTVARSWASEVPGLTTNRAHDKVREITMKLVGADNHRRSGLGTRSVRERNVNNDHLPPPKGNRRGHRLPLPKLPEDAPRRAVSTPGSPGHVPTTAG